MSKNTFSAITNAIFAGASKLRELHTPEPEPIVVPIEDQIEELRTRVEQLNIESEGKATQTNVVPLVSELLILGEQSRIQEYFEMLLENGEIQIPQNIQNRIVNEWIDNNRPSSIIGHK